MSRICRNFHIFILILCGLVFAIQATGLESRLDSTNSTEIKCQLNGKALDSCQNPVKGTIAIFSCKPGFEDESLAFSASRIFYDGSWDLPFPRCLPICGVPTQKNLETLPWNVAIYNRDKKFMCGATIVSERAVLSVAHCFTNEQGVPIDKSNFLIAAGKMYQSYDDARDGDAQYSDVKELYIPSLYRGDLSNYRADMAVVMLKQPFAWSMNVQPICTYHIGRSYEEPTLLVVPTWSLAMEGSPIPNHLKVPPISYDACFNDVPEPFRKYLVNDKGCLKISRDDLAEKRLYSGGGVFALDNERYYLAGILSVGTGMTSGSHDYAAYTLVLSYFDFLSGLKLYE